MTGKPLPWLKLDHRYLENPQLGCLPDSYQLRFYKLYMLAHQCRSDGLITLSPAEIAWKLHISVEELDQTYQILERINLFRNNGRGPEIPTYIQDGNPTIKEQEEAKQKKADQRKRQKHVPSDVPHHVPSDVPHHVPSDVPPRESESDIESESDKESESQSSQSSRTKAQVQADGLTDDILFPQIFKLMKIPEKYQDDLTTDPTIHASDLLAEYSRNSKKKNISKPGSITAMNLLRHEYPEDKFYDASTWIQELPSEIRDELDLENRNLRSYVSGEYSEMIEH